MFNNSPAPSPFCLDKYNLHWAPRGLSAWITARQPSFTLSEEPLHFLRDDLQVLTRLYTITPNYSTKSAQLGTETKWTRYSVTALTNSDQILVASNYLGLSVKLFIIYKLNSHPRGSSNSQILWFSLMLCILLCLESNSLKYYLLHSSTVVRYLQ